MKHYKVNKLRFMRRAKEVGLSRGKLTRLRNAFHRAVREGNRTGSPLEFVDSYDLDSAITWFKTVQGHAYWRRWAKVTGCSGWY